MRLFILLLVFFHQESKANIGYFEPMGGVSTFACSMSNTLLTLHSSAEWNELIEATIASCIHLLFGLLTIFASGFSSTLVYLNPEIYTLEMSATDQQFNEA